MKTLDRYIVWNFLTTALLFFVAMMLLRIVMDLFVNIDEFTELQTETFAAKLAHVGSYYGYKSLVYFTELGGVIIVVSTAFTLARMNHTNELTAMLASGVSLYRVTMPIVLCAMAIGGLIILDQELIIPRVAYQLTLDRDEAMDTKEFEIRIATDGAGTAWYARKYHVSKQVMTQPAIVIRNKRFRMLAGIYGSQARPKTFNGQVGWAISDAVLTRTSRKDQLWLHSPDCTRIWSQVGPLEILKEARRTYQQGTGRDVPLDRILGWPNAMVEDASCGLTIRAKHFKPEPHQPEKPPWQRGGLLEQPTFTFKEPDGQVLGHFVASSARWRTDPQAVSAEDTSSAREHSIGYWELTDGEAFYPSDMTPEELVLRSSRRWLSYMSTSDLARLIQLKRVPDRKSAQLIKHVRFTAPINNLVMLLLGLPFILSRERNIKASATLCLLTVGVFFLFVYLCQGMRLSPLLAAWLPIFLFGPVSIIMLDALKT